MCESEPFLDETAEPAQAFLHAIDAVTANRHRQGLAVLDRYIGVGTVVGGEREARCRRLAAIAPLIAAAGFAELYPARDCLWFFDSEQLADQLRGPADIAALRVIMAHLNKDSDAAQAIGQSLVAVGGHDALVDLVVSTLKICVALRHQGAFAAFARPPAAR